MSPLVKMTARATTIVMANSIMAQLLALIPPPAQSTATRAAATFAIDATVIHPKYTLNGKCTYRLSLEDTLTDMKHRYGAAPDFVAQIMVPPHL